MPEQIIFQHLEPKLTGGRRVDVASLRRYLVPRGFQDRTPEFDRIVAELKAAQGCNPINSDEEIFLGLYIDHREALLYNLTLPFYKTTGFKAGVAVGVGATVVAVLGGLASFGILPMVLAITGGALLLAGVLLGPNMLFESLIHAYNRPKFDHAVEIMKSRVDQQPGGAGSSISAGNADNGLVGPPVVPPAALPVGQDPAARIAPGSVTAMP